MKNFKDGYVEILKSCQHLGIQYHDMLTMTLDEINNIGIAENQKHVDNINDMLLVAYQQAAMTAIGMNNPRKFPQKSPQVQLKTSKIDNPDPSKILDQFWGIAGMLGVQRPGGE